MSEASHSHAAFVTTRWSVVAHARGDEPSARDAREQLCRAYWFPLYAFARRSGQAPADAQDLVQGFFVQVIEKDLFQQADADKGRLRTFLLTAFKRHIGHVARREAAHKRGGGQAVVSFDALEAEDWYADQLIDGESPETMYDRQWALTLLDTVMAELAREWEQSGRGDLFPALRPFLTRSPEPAEYAAVETALGMSRPALKSAVHRLRGRYRDLLLRQVRETQLLEDDGEAELRALLAALNGASHG